MMYFRPTRFLILLLTIGMLGLAACDSSSSDSDDDDSDGGGNAAEAEFGINLVNTGSDAFDVGYVRAFCRSGETRDACLARGLFAGRNIVDPNENVVDGLGSPGEDEVSLYVEWEVLSGQGRVEVVRAVETDDGPAMIEEVLDSFSVDTEDEGSATISLN